MPDWLTLLRDDVARGSITQTARKVGVHRSSISLALAGKYPAGTDKLEAKVLESLDGTMVCAFDGNFITARTCRRRCDDPMPTSSPAALKAWSACQACPQKPQKRG